MAKYIGLDWIGFPYPQRRGLPQTPLPTTNGSERLRRKELQQGLGVWGPEREKAERTRRFLSSRDSRLPEGSRRQEETETLLPP